MQATFTTIFFLYGLIFGSFFNVVGLRVPKGTLFAQTRSYCDTCQRTLTWQELIPVWSFVRQKGACSQCGEKISPIYPIIELTTALLFAFTFYQYGWSSQTLLGVLLISLVIPVTVSDLAYRRIPNKLLLFFTPLFLAFRLLTSVTSIWLSILGALLAFGLVFLIIFLSNGGMGAGDMKYYTLLGFVFGPISFLLLFFLSTVFGAVGGLVIMKIKKSGRKTMIAFGPFIGMATMTVFYFGDTIIQWYMSLFN